MTETQYTEKDLQNMADQLLREADQQQHEIEEEVIKGNKGRLDEKTIASLPAAQLIQNNERLKELFVKGKRHGKLESSELSDVLDTMDLESEKLDMIYDSLDKLSIEITAEAFLPDVTSETEPPLDEIAEIEEEELVDPNSLVDSFNIDDPVRMYLKEIGKVSLLSAEGEVELASAIAAGNKAKATLIAWEKANGQDVEPLLDAEDPVGEIEISDEEIKDLSEEDLAKLRKLVSEGDVAKQKLAEANLRLVVSIAKRYAGRGMLFLDLIQEGNLGLIKAVEKFDYTKGYKFSTYATWWIRQAITRAIADQARTIRIPVHMVETINKVIRVSRQLLQELGHDPHAGGDLRANEYAGGQGARDPQDRAGAGFSGDPHRRGGGFPSGRLYPRRGRVRAFRSCQLHPAEGAAGGRAEYPHSPRRKGAEAALRH